MEVAFAENRKKGRDQEQFLFLKLTNKPRFLRSWTRKIIFGSFKNIWSKLFISGTCNLVIFI